MAIDIESETVISFAVAAKRLPPAREGKRRHPATIWRYARHGVRGVKLEAIRVGGGLCTSVQALQRFCDRLSETEPIGATSTASIPVRTSAAQQRAAQAAGRKLAAIGI